MCLALAACTTASSNSSSSSSAPDGTAAAVSLRIKVPTYGEFGLGSTAFRFDKPLTDAERRRVDLEMTTPGPEEVVAAAATVSTDGRQITVVAGVARRRSADRHLHGLSVEGSARTQEGAVEGDGGYLLLGPAFVRPTAHRSRYGGKARIVGGGSTAAKSEARNAPACPSFERSLSRSLKPILLSGARFIRTPSYMPANGSKAVDNRSPAGLMLDQIVGELCRHNFKSAWLRGLVSRRG
jgi:hypothetical protein